MVPNVLPRWSYKYLADGVYLVPPPEDAAKGAIRIRDRERPLRRFKDIVELTIKELPYELADRQMSALDCFTTGEGEYCGLVTLSGTAAGSRKPLEKTIGVVYGDDFYSLIESATHDAAVAPALRSAVRDLTYFSSLGLGDKRRRWFLYDPPKGWKPYGRGAITEWLPPDFPANTTMIAAYPVRLARDTPNSALDRLLHEFSWYGFQRQASEQPQRIFSAHRLNGFLSRTVGQYPGQPKTYLDVAFFQDERFIYVLRCQSLLESGPHLDALKAMIASVHPIPFPDVTEPTSSTVPEHWIA
jgi:hypothetical protein